MLCPKCKIDNPDNADVCLACGALLEKAAIKKTSKLAVISFILSLCSAVLFVIAALPAFILACISLSKIRKNSQTLKGKVFAVCAIVISVFFSTVFSVCVLGLLIAWTFDAPPIQDDYTIADLSSVPEQDLPSYDILMTLANDPNAPDGAAIGLLPSDIRLTSEITQSFRDSQCQEKNFSEISIIVAAHETEITDLWQKVRPAMAVIDELNTFDQIADLTPPGLTANCKTLWPNLRHLYQVNNLYIRLKIRQGNYIEAVTELIRFDSVIRKLRANSRSFTSRVYCFGFLEGDMAVVNLILNDPQAPANILEITAKYFVPLRPEQTSLRNAILYEYLTFKEAYSSNFGKSFGLAAKKNSSCRLNRNYWNHIAAVIEPSYGMKPQVKVWPSFYPDLPSLDYSTQKISSWYKIYNPVGSSIVCMFLYPGNNASWKPRIEVYDDLLQIALNKRLGGEVNLKARAYSDKYIIDKDQKIIFSPGPDGKPYTQDDIKLPFDPNILHF